MSSVLSIYVIFFALSAAIPPPRGTARAAGIETGRALFIMKQLPPSGGRRQPICRPFPFSGQTGKFLFPCGGICAILVAKLPPDRANDCHGRGGSHFANREVTRP